METNISQYYECECTSLPFEPNLKMGEHVPVGKQCITNSAFGIEVWGEHMPSSSCNEIEKTHTKFMYWHLRGRSGILYRTLLETLRLICLYALQRGHTFILSLRTIYLKITFRNHMGNRVLTKKSHKSQILSFNWLEEKG